MTTFTLHSILHSFRIPPIPSTSIFSTSFKDTNKQFGFFKCTKLFKSRIIVYSSSSSPKDAVSGDNTQSNFYFCIIEGPETVQDFVQMQLQEIQDSIKSRRKKIFLLMEEVRRLRVQQRIRSVQKVFNEDGEEESYELPEIQSSIPFLPLVWLKALLDPQKDQKGQGFNSWKRHFWEGQSRTPKCISSLPKSERKDENQTLLLELKLGIGGTSYEDFIRNMHLPMQLSQVDPIVASFSGGAVGVISVLMLIEASNVEKQEKNMCKYCHGTAAGSYN